MALAIGGVWVDLDEDDEDLALPRWLEMLLETIFGFWSRLQDRLGRRN